MAAKTTKSSPSKASASKPPASKAKAKAKAKAKTPAKAKAKAPAKAAASKKAPVKAAKKATAGAKPEAKSAAKPAAKKTVAKAEPKKAAAKKAPVAKPAAKKTVAKAEPKQVAPKKAAPEKAAAKKSTGKATPAPAAKPAKPRKRPSGTARIDAQPADFTPYSRKKNEDYMNEDQRGHFRQILLDWKRQLMEEVDRTVNHMKDVAANDPDPADRATQEEEFSLELRTRDRERKLIRKIDSTIDLIDQDDYGYCESCGIEIGILRLEARPTATQCIDCKTLDEIKERQIHG